MSLGCLCLNGKTYQVQESNTQGHHKETRSKKGGRIPWWNWKQWGTDKSLSAVKWSSQLQNIFLLFKLSCKASQQQVGGKLSKNTKVTSKNLHRGSHGRLKRASLETGYREAWAKRHCENHSPIPSLRFAFTWIVQIILHVEKQNQNCIFRNQIQWNHTWSSFNLPNNANGSF